MADNKKEQARAELHRTIWGIANDLRGSVMGGTLSSTYQCKQRNERLVKLMNGIGEMNLVTIRTTSLMRLAMPQGSRLPNDEEVRPL